jgi:hypothetical protein
VVKSIAMKWYARAGSLALSLPKGTADLYRVKAATTSTYNNLQGYRGLLIFIQIVELERKWPMPGDLTMNTKLVWVLSSKITSRA